MWGVGSEVGAQGGQGPGESLHRERSPVGQDADSRMCRIGKQVTELWDVVQVGDVG